MGKIVYIFQRLREPSSHAALASLVAFFGISEADFSKFESWAVLAFGLIGVFVKEAKPETKVDGF
jgi:hypothetical protein